MIYLAALPSFSSFSPSSLFAPLIPFSTYTADAPFRATLKHLRVYLSPLPALWYNEPHLIYPLARIGAPRLVLLEWRAPRALSAGPGLGLVDALVAVTRRAKT